MTTPPKIPAWITQPEFIEGDPITRHPEYEKTLDFSIEAENLWLDSIANQAIRAFDGQLEANMGLLKHIAESTTRAEAAEAECEKLRKELRSTESFDLRIMAKAMLDAEENARMESAITRRETKEKLE